MKRRRIQKFSNNLFNQSFDRGMLIVACEIQWTDEYYVNLQSSVEHSGRIDRFFGSLHLKGKYFIYLWQIGEDNYRFWL